METDFKAVRYHLACALAHFAGPDETTARFREALYLMLEAAAVAEHRKPDPKIVPFRARWERRKLGPRQTMAATSLRCAIWMSGKLAIKPARRASLEDQIGCSPQNLTARVTTTKNNRAERVCGSSDGRQNNHTAAREGRIPTLKHGRYERNLSSGRAARHGNHAALVPVR